MYIYSKYIVFFVLLSWSMHSFAQLPSEERILQRDTLPFDKEHILYRDTVPYGEDQIYTDFDNLPIQNTKKTEGFKPDALRSVWMGAIIPGYGQVVNRKYWKLPIIYGGFIAVGYVANWNAQQHQVYKIAYRDIIDNDPNTNSFLEILPKGYTVNQIFGSQDRYKDHLKMAYDKSRRYRDLWILGTILYCGLTVLEAYVDASLYDFDVSPDLSMHIKPSLTVNELALQADGLNRLRPNNSFGLKCSLRLK